MFLVPRSLSLRPPSITVYWREDDGVRVAPEGYVESIIYRREGKSQVWGTRHRESGPGTNHYECPGGNRADGSNCQAGPEQSSSSSFAGPQHSGLKSTLGQP